MQLTNNTHTLTATRHKSPATHTGPTTVQIGKRRIPVNNTVVVPSLKKPLLSANQVAQHFDVVLQKDKIYVTKPQVETPNSVITK